MFFEENFINKYLKAVFMRFIDYFRSGVNEVIAGYVSRRDEVNAMINLYGVLSDGNGNLNELFETSQNNTEAPQDGGLLGVLGAQAYDQLHRNDFMEIARRKFISPTNDK